MTCVDRRGVTGFYVHHFSVSMALRRRFTFFKLVQIEDICQSDRQTVENLKLLENFAVAFDH